MRTVRPVAPKTATRAQIRWTYTPEGRKPRKQWWGGRPYSWAAHALKLIDFGCADLEVQFLTRLGWGKWQKIEEVK